jgi:hypothetical protein
MIGNDNLFGVDDDNDRLLIENDHFKTANDHFILKSSYYE